MPRIEQVMLSAVFSPEDHTNFPYYATPKVDGIRFYIQDGKVWSRSNKLIPNRQIQQTLPLYLPDGVDGELVAGKLEDADSFQQTSSVVMSDDAPLDSLSVYVFDFIQPDNFCPVGKWNKTIASSSLMDCVSLAPLPGYSHRITYFKRWFESAQFWVAGQFCAHNFPPATNRILAKTGSVATEADINFDIGCGRLSLNSPTGKILDHLIRSTTVLTPIALRSLSDVDLYLDQCLKLGWEGIMLRKPDGLYKFGRCSASEELLLKHKPLADAEAVVVGFEELRHNKNEAFTSETGKTKRSSAAEGKVGGNTLGAFICCLPEDAVKVCNLQKVKANFAEAPKGFTLSYNAELKETNQLLFELTFRIGGGPGVTAEFRKSCWEKRDKLLGRVVKFSYLKVGTKDKPRMPKFLGFRSTIDAEVAV